MLREIEGNDWQETWKYNDPSIPFTCKPVSTAKFDREDVESIFAIAEGKNDGPDWVCAGQLIDGRWFIIRAGCDYTGWD